jgi:hypothetical protein
MVYYDLAARWDIISDEEVDKFKTFLKARLNISESIKVDCRREWLNGIYMDIYFYIGADESDLQHYWIDRADNLTKARE